MGLFDPPSVGEPETGRSAPGSTREPAREAANNSSRAPRRRRPRDFAEEVARIAVVGVGGAGSNVVNRMVDQGVRGIKLIAINSDAQALTSSRAPDRLQIGERLTQGRSSGGDPKTGEQAAEDASDAIRVLIGDVDLVFVTGGMGGGIGTGAAPVIARLAREAGILAVGVVTTPFAFEGTRRRKVAEAGVERLRACVDTLIVIPNDQLLHLIDESTSIQQAFALADDVLRQGIQGISELITIPGLINLDFADVRAVMADGGTGLMAVGQAKGKGRAQAAADQATRSALLDISIEDARSLLFNITGGPDLTLHEVNQAAEIISRTVDPDANIIFGAVIEPEMEDAIRITLIATGFGAASGAAKGTPVAGHPASRTTMR